jgi:16S rRNA processing protein RimM
VDVGLRRRKQNYAQNQIFLGRISKPHALSGEVKYIPFGSSLWLLEELGTVHVEGADFDLEVEYVRGSDNAPIIKFRGIDDRDASEALMGQVLWVEVERLPALGEDEIYESELLFARVLNEQGEELGRIEEIMETGASDVLVIRGADGSELLVPAIRDVIREIRKTEQVVVIRFPEHEE